MRGHFLTHTDKYIKGGEGGGVYNVQKNPPHSAENLLAEITR